MSIRTLVHSALAKFGLQLSRAPRYRENSARPEIMIVGPYQLHNFGDDLIGMVLAKYLSSKDLTVSVPGMSVENCRAFGLVGPQKFGTPLLPTKALVIGGGGLLGDAGVRPKDDYMKLALDKVQHAAKDEIPSVIVGVGAGPLSVPAHVELAQELTSRVTSVGVRDTQSYEFCREKLGLAPDKLVLGADIALLWSKLFDMPKIASDLVGLQCDVSGWLPESQADVVRKGFIDHARRLPSETMTFTPLQRSEIGERLHDALIPNLSYSELKNYLPILAGFKAVVTTHLHVSIAAYAAGVPCFAIYVNEKTKRFYDQIGHPERAIAASNVSATEMDQLFERARQAEWTESDQVNLERLQKDAEVLLASLDSIG